VAKTLVTGGAGFIGAHVASELLRRGHSVVVLDDLSGGFRENLPAAARFVQGSIVDRKLVDELFAAEKFDYVFHLAAYAAEGLSHFIRRFNYENNLIGSVNLINAAVRAEVKRFVYTSSIAVYGFLEPPLSESTQPVPADPYGIAKLAVEQDLQAAHEIFGLNYTIFRPHNVYGEFQNIGDRYRNVVGIFMNQILQDQPLTVFGDGQQRRAFSYVSDVAGPIARCIEVSGTSGEIFNIGADQPYSVLDLATAVMKSLGKKVPLQHLPPRHEAQHSYSDHQKIREFFSGLPSPVALEEGLARMAKWARTRGALRSAPYSNIELTKNLPPSWLNEIK
jgi:UDP-glucose 4-epimerase